MTDRRAFLYVSPNHGHVFPEAATGDMLVYTSRSNQKILMGTRKDVPAELTVTDAGISARRLGIGTSAPQLSVDLKTTDALGLPAGSNATRPALSRPGMIRYNAEIDAFEGMDAALDWTSLGGVIDIDRDTRVAASNDNTVNIFASNALKATVDYDAFNVFGALSVANGQMPVNFETSSFSFWNRTSNQDLYYADGRVGIGTAAPRVALDLAGRSDAMALPVGTSNQRPAAPLNGLIRYNSQSHGVESFANGGWIPLGSSGLNASTMNARLEATSNFAYGYMTQLAQTTVQYAYSNFIEFTDSATQLLLQPISEDRLPVASGSGRGLVFLSDNVNNPSLVYSNATAASAAAARLAYSNAETRVSKSGDTMTGPLTSTRFIGVGSNLTDLNAGSLTWGTVSTAVLPAATTSVRGICSLYDGVDSTSNNVAATANAARLAFSNAQNSLSLSGGTLTGNLGFSGAARTIGAIDNNAFSLITSNQTRVAITNTGDVGIGTTVPVARLHVAGTFYAPGSIVQVQSGSFSNTVTGTNIITFADISPNFEVNITPRFATSRMLIQGMLHIGGRHSVDGRFTFIRLARSNAAGIAEVGNGFTAETGNLGSPCLAAHNWGGDTADAYNFHIANVSVSVMDTNPNVNATSIGPINYRFRWATSPGGSSSRVGYLNRTETHNDGYRPNTISTITVYEIAQ